MMYVEFMKNYFLADSSEMDSFRPDEPKNDSYFLDMMHVEFKKNVVLADSFELMAVRLISAS